MTDVLSGLDGAQRARIADLRRQGRFFWLDVSLQEAGRDRLVEALGVPEAALRALPGSGAAADSANDGWGGVREKRLQHGFCNRAWRESSLWAV